MHYERSGRGNIKRKIMTSRFLSMRYIFMLILPLVSMTLLLFPHHAYTHGGAKHKNPISAHFQVVTDSQCAHLIFLITNESDKTITLHPEHPSVFDIKIYKKRNEKVNSFYLTGEELPLSVQNESFTIPPRSSKKWILHWNYVSEKHGRVPEGHYEARLQPYFKERQYFEKMNLIQFFDVPPPSYSNAVFKDISVVGKDGAYQLHGSIRKTKGTFSYMVDNGHDILVQEKVNIDLSGSGEWFDFMIDINISADRLTEYQMLNLYLIPNESPAKNSLYIPIDYLTE